MNDRRYVPVAEVARPHGLRGELRIRPYNADSDLLLAKPALRLRMGDGSERDAVVTAARAVHGAVLVRLRGVEDRDAAEALRGTVVCVERTDLPATEEGEFYAFDLEGARVELPNGEMVGTVRTITSYPTCDVLVVNRDGRGPLEVPLTDAYVESVDAERGLVRLVTVEGLE